MCRRKGYALLLILVFACTGCVTTKFDEGKPNTLINADLIIVANQSQVAEILSVLSNYSANFQIMQETEFFKNGESILMMTVTIQYHDSLDLKQIIHRLGSNYQGIRSLDFRNP